MDYFDWIHSLVDLFIDSLQREIGKGFIRDEGMTWEAAKHSEAMMWRRDYYHAPREYLGSALSELVSDGYASYYNQRSIEQLIKKVSRGFLDSPLHGPSLRFFSVIGVGIAVLDLRSNPVEIDGKIYRVAIYTAVRLRQ